MLFSCYNNIKKIINMPRIRKEKNSNWSKEEKLRIIYRHLKDGLSTRITAKEEDISGVFLI